jgi:endonuclease V-like protein UPF0215 family
MHLAKKGLRVLGIAESFRGRTASTLAGVVMRKDLRIDGVAVTRLSVGGMDATDAVLRILGSLRRRDVNAVLLSGAVIAWYNILDPARIHDESGLPVIVVTYEDSDGLEEDLRHHFPEDIERMAAYRRLGDRIPLDLPTGYRAFLRAWGMEQGDAARLCTDFTIDGKVPEPCRVARLVARAAMQEFGPGE